MRSLFVLVIIGMLMLQTRLCYATINMQIAGTYTNLHYNEEAGDLLGYEVMIVPHKNGFQGTFLASDGEPDALVLIEPNLRDDNINFTIPKKSRYAGKFVGKITKGGLVGTLTRSNGIRIQMDLKRGHSYWDEK